MAIKLITKFELYIKIIFSILATGFLFRTIQLGYFNNYSLMRLWIDSSSMLYLYGLYLNSRKNRKFTYIFLFCNTCYIIYYMIVFQPNIVLLNIVANYITIVNMKNWFFDNDDIDALMKWRKERLVKAYNVNRMVIDKLKEGNMNHMNKESILHLEQQNIYLGLMTCNYR